MTLPNPPTISTRDLGVLAYPPALALQRQLNQQVIDGHQPSTILLVEHEPVITLTRRPAVRQHLLADEQQLASLGVAMHETDRGGDITYHGPGQLVVYPILKLADFNLNLSSYMRLLEQAVIDTVATMGITAHRECGATGVWVGAGPEACGLRLEGESDKTLVTLDPNRQSPTPNPRTAKLCAMGVRIRKNTTLHGLALNVDPDLSHFSLIVPCGLLGRPVTSLRQLLGDNCPTMQQVKQLLLQTLINALCNVDKAACGAVNGSAQGTTSDWPQTPGRRSR